MCTHLQTHRHVLTVIGRLLVVELVLQLRVGCVDRGGRRRDWVLLGGENGINIHRELVAAWVRVPFCIMAVLPWPVVPGSQSPDWPDAPD